MSWAYWAPKSTTSTAWSCSGEAGVPAVKFSIVTASLEALDRRQTLVTTCSIDPPGAVAACCSLVVLLALIRLGAGVRWPARRSAPPGRPGAERRPDPSVRRRTPITDNDFIPGRDLDDCISALPQPGCGSEARSGWRQCLIFVAPRRRRLSFIAWRIVAQRPRRDRALSAAAEPWTPTSSGPAATS